jgi:hypothetical protein
MKNFYYTLELNLAHPTIKNAFSTIAKQFSGASFLQTRSRAYATMNDALLAIQQEALENVNLIRDNNDGLTLEQSKLMNPLHFGEEMLWDEGEEGPTVEDLEMDDDELEFWQDDMLSSYTFIDPTAYGFTMRYILHFFDDPITEMQVGHASSFFMDHNLSSTMH